ncbi:hypothetical protein ABZV78_02770 [Micromonospora sp. NPDC004540]|uniref:hypothetical protein n=1 Tax=Micromonospora sp. NPDC004540 TaxID=3154457 RepID=UPI0033BB19B0
MNRPTPFDFGLTWFATQFHQDWRYSGTADELIGKALGPETDPWEVEALRRDAASMLHGLTAEEIELLWITGTWQPIFFGPDAASPSGPEWLRLIIERCVRWQQEHGESPRPEADWESGIALADAVASEIVGLAASVPEEWSPEGRLTTTLLRCNRACSPDLALRWSLRMATQHVPSIKADQFARLLRLGEALGYGEYVVPELLDWVE